MRSRARMVRPPEPVCRCSGLGCQGRLTRFEAGQPTAYSLPMPFLPRLRPDLEVTPTPDGVLLGDPLFRRRLDLGSIGDVLAKLDGRTAEDLVADGPRTEQVLRTLLLLQMLDGSDARVIERMR